MKVYQISSAIGGPLKQSDFKESSETIQICLSHLIKSLHVNGHVEGLSLKEFQERLQHAISDMGDVFDSEVVNDKNNDEEVYGTFECEFDWPTNSHPKDFAPIFAKASDINHVFEQLPHCHPSLCEIQIMLSDQDANWITFVAGGIRAEDGFMEWTWEWKQ